MCRSIGHALLGRSFMYGWRLNQSPSRSRVW